jgi:hypothetical protein
LQFCVAVVSENVTLPSRRVTRAMSRGCVSAAVTPQLLPGETERTLIVTPFAVSVALSMRML